MVCRVSSLLVSFLPPSSDSDRRDLPHQFRTQNSRQFRAAADHDCSRVVFDDGANEATGGWAESGAVYVRGRDQRQGAVG